MLGAKYKILYHPEVPKRGRIYEGDNWSESSDNNDDPVWCSMLPQMPPWIRNSKRSDEELEAVCNPWRVLFLDLKWIAKALEKTIKAKTKPRIQEETKYLEGNTSRMLKYLVRPGTMWVHRQAHRAIKATQIQVMTIPPCPGR